MTVKAKIVQYYSPNAGTWYRIKVKFLFIWWTLPLCFDSKAMACQNFRELSEAFHRPLTSIEDEKFKELSIKEALKEYLELY